MSDTPGESTDGYEGYAQWKRWQGSFEVREREARYFAAEFRGMPLRGKRVLEIGFGSGSFLTWAKFEGAEVCAARNASLGELVGEDARYDLIVAFDVIEHWDTDELIANFRHIAALLADDGVFLARFPNGHSPFGRVYQHGDFTHKSVISHYKIGYLATISNLDVVRVANVRRVSSRPGALRALRHRWMALRRA